jgi:Mg-chelatase subunit ChlD
MVVFTVMLVFTAAVVFAQKQQRFLFVTAVDLGGNPVLDLKPSDFEVSEGGIRRTVVRVDQGTTPMRIALVVDTSRAAELALNPLRSALIAFVDAMPPQHEIALVSVGRQARVRFRPSIDRTKLRGELKSLFADGGAPALLDGVRESYDAFMRQPDVRWPVFVIVTTDVVDGGSNRDPVEYSRFVNDLRLRGVVAHAVVLQQGTQGSAVEYALDLTRQTGGRYEFANAATGLEACLARVAARLNEDHRDMTNIYQVEYLSDTRPQGEIELIMMRANVRLMNVSIRR